METPWTKEEEDLLVDLYRKHELLWNPQHANYSRRGARLVAIRALTARFSGSQSIYALPLQLPSGRPVGCHGDDERLIAQKEQQLIALQA